jgi:hypothetical protein
MAFNNSTSDAVKRRGSVKCHIELGMGGKTGDCGYTVTRLRVCPRTLMIVIAKALVIGDLILRGLKGMIGRDAHN